MNMPNSKGVSTHPMTLEYPVESLDEMCSVLNQSAFVIFKLAYMHTNSNGENWWQDRGEIIINTEWVGKIQEFIEFDRDTGSPKNETKPRQIRSLL